MADDGEHTGFDAIDRAIDDFEQLLLRHGVTVVCGSALEEACLHAKSLVDLHAAARAGQQTPIDDGFRDELRQALGALGLAQLIVKTEGHPEFQRLVPHLRLLGSGSPLQTKPAPITDSDSNKLVELRMGLACLQTGSDLEMDDPVASSDGENPDVLCRMRDGRLWGLACKVVHGDAPMTLFERLEEGVEQIESSKAEIGVVVVSFKNRLPHDDFFPELARGDHGQILGVHFDWQDVRDAVSRAFLQRVHDMAHVVGAAPLVRLFDGKKALPALASPLDVVTGVLEGGMPAPTHIAYLQLAGLDPARPLPEQGPVFNVLTDLNAGLMAGREPRETAAS